MYRIPLPIALAGSVVTAPSSLRVKPSVNRFMTGYVRHFPVHDVGGRWIVHSHLPPLNSPAYRRFVQLHLIDAVEGPSHAQVGVTNACPQDCLYCYNKQRRGRRMDTSTILQAIDELKAMGVVWLGLTGGEPLLNRDLARIIERGADGCSVKLFTSGTGLTPQTARDLAHAGLFSVCVSLDHWDPAVHDANRRYPGAFDIALRSIAMLRAVDGLHVGVSSVVSREMLEHGEVTRLLEFLESLDVHEAWLSEVKPSVDAFWSSEHVFGEAERLRLCALQEEWNRGRGRNGMTVNYLGHFEGRETFGCNAGCKMVYIDAFGEVSPCVFMPMTLGNVRERLLGDLVAEMRSRMSCRQDCWINQNYPLLQAAAVEGDHMLDRTRSIEVLNAAAPSPPPAFERVRQGGDGSARPEAAAGGPTAAGTLAAGASALATPTADSQAAAAPAADLPVPAADDDRQRKHDGLVRLTGYSLAATFAVVGALFLAIPADVLRALNWVGDALGLPAAPVTGHGFYVGLAVAYMYVVTVLAVQIARHPRERAYPTVLLHAKAASSLLSLALFLVQEQYFIYLANLIVDGAIALFVYWLCLRPVPRSTGREP